MAITLQMAGIYPDISSGIITFRNPRTETEIKIKAPEDLQRDSYGIRSITMDPGAGGTILPERFIKKLDLQKPSKNDKEYYVFSGVGGSSMLPQSLAKASCFLAQSSSHIPKRSFLLSLHLSAIVAATRWKSVLPRRSSKVGG